MNNSIDPKKTRKFSTNKKNDSLREADLITHDIDNFLDKTFVFIRKTRVKTWQGVFILAFVAGIAVATVMTVSFNIQTNSEAAEGSELSLYTANTAVTLESGSDTVNMDVLLDSHENNVVAVKAIVKYDPDNFELQNVDTAQSVFADDNTCVYNGDPCQIVTRDDTNGEIVITLAKPSPGVNVDSGVIAQLTFKALSIVNPSSNNFTIDYTAESYADSDVIVDDGNGTDILSSALGIMVGVYTAACDPNATTYTDWSECQNGTRTRTIDVASPAGCNESGLADQLSESCTVEPVICSSFAYGDWGECQVGGTQTRTVTGSPAGCEGGNPDVSEQSCPFIPETCTEFTYGGWGDCQPDGTRTRAVTSSSPAGCTGGTPETEGSCSYSAPDVTCTNFTYGDWGACQLGGTQVRAIISSSPEGCSGGSPVVEQGCAFTASTCTEFTYSDWSDCQSSETKSRTVNSSSPAGCSGGEPVLTTSCKYKEEKKKDKEKPKFTDLPLFLTKSRGEMIWWKAKDNEGIDYYTYNFDGKKVKTKKKNFLIPTSTKKGVYMLRVKAYDEAGNSKSRIVTVRVK